MTPPQSREQQAREMLAGILAPRPNESDEEWRAWLLEKPRRLDGELMRAETTLCAMIAFADAERERCARIADACAVRADRVEVINAFGVEAASNVVKLAEGIAAAIRNPLYQHGDEK